MASTQKTQALDNPLENSAFISKIASQVSLPYKKPPEGVKEIIKRNGDLVVSFMTHGECLPYGRYPRLFEMWLTTMIKTEDDCINLQTRTVEIGSTFRGFMKLVGSPVGGRQMRAIKAQLENWLGSSWSITNTSERYSRGVQFPISEKWHIDWMSHEPQEDALFKNYFVISERYLEMLKDKPIPVDLRVISKLRKPMALDIYCWLTRRYSYLHERQTITWDQLRSQFGSDAKENFKFKQQFEHALKDVLAVWPEAKITCGKTVTLYPSSTSVPTKVEREQKASLDKINRPPTARTDISEATISDILEHASYEPDSYISVRKRILTLWKLGKSKDEIISEVTGDSNL
jgi:hypothetical protein